MLLRYKARNFPQSLSAAERAEWVEYVRQRLQYGEEKSLSHKGFLTELTALKEQASESQLGLLTALAEYAEQKEKAFNISVEAKVSP